MINSIHLLHTSLSLRKIMQDSQLYVSRRHGLRHSRMYLYFIYELTNRPRSCSAHGGLIIYPKEDCTYKERQLSNDSWLWEVLLIDIDHEGLEYKITLTNMHRPPKITRAMWFSQNSMTKFTLLWTNFHKKIQFAFFQATLLLDFSKINERTKLKKKVLTYSS